MRRRGLSKSRASFGMVANCVPESFRASRCRGPLAAVIGPEIRGAIADRPNPCRSKKFPSVGHVSAGLKRYTSVYAKKSTARAQSW